MEAQNCLRLVEKVIKGAVDICFNQPKKRQIQVQQLMTVTNSNAKITLKVPKALWYNNLSS